LETTTNTDGDTGANAGGDLNAWAAAPTIKRYVTKINLKKAADAFIRVSIFQKRGLRVPSICSVV